MKQISLKDNLIEVVRDTSIPSYGGNQGWFTDNEYGNIARQGCGVITAVDTLLYINGLRNLTYEKYSHEVRQFCHNRRMARLFMRDILIRKYDNHYLSLGILPCQISGYLNHMMKSTGRNIRFRWNGIQGHRDMYQKMKYLISNDYPVIWSLYSLGRQIRLYLKSEDGQDFIYSNISVNSHYVTATAIWEDYSISHPRMIEVSSWGKKYYIDYDEYLEYVGKSIISAYCSNIIFIKRK